MDQPSDLPVVEFAFPGPLRDRIVAAITAGQKTATASLVHEYERAEEPLPAAGARGVVVDSEGSPTVVIETTSVEVVRLADVTDDHAVAEGEGYRSAAEWRAGHERFWNSPAARAELDPAFVLDDDTRVVLERFRIV